MTAPSVDMVVYWQQDVAIIGKRSREMINEVSVVGNERKYILS